MSDQDDKDDFQKNILCDSMIGDLHFSKADCNIIRGIQALHPKTNSFLEESPLFFFILQT